MRRFGDLHAVEQLKRVAIREEFGGIEGDNLAVLGKDSPVVILDAQSRSGEGRRGRSTALSESRECHKAQLDALGKRAVRDGVMHQSPRKIKLPHRRAHQLMTSVVRTLVTPISWQNPISNVLMPAESTSVSSVRLPTPIITGIVGKRSRTAR